MTDPRRWEARLEARNHVGPFTRSDEDSLECAACGYYVVNDEDEP